MSTQDTAKQTEQLKPSHLQFADAIKGLAILFVLLYHLVAPCAPKTVINNLSEDFLCLFFLYSGYFYKPGKNTVTGNIAKRVKSLIVPFVKYSLIFWVAGSVYLVATKAAPLIEAVKCLRNFFIGAMWNRVIQDWFKLEYYSLGKRYYFLADFWFLLALLFASILFFVIADKVLRSKAATVISCLLLFALSGVLTQFQVIMPYNLHMTPFWTAFLLLGAAAKQFDIFRLPGNKIARWIIGGVLLITGVTVAMIKEPSLNLFRGSYGENEFISMLLCLAAMIPFMWGLSMIFVLIEESGIKMSVLAWAGSHSMTYYLWHMFYGWIISTITGFHILYKEPLEDGAVWKSLLVTAAVIVLCTVHCIVVDKVTQKIKEGRSKSNLT